MIRNRIELPRRWQCGFTLIEVVVALAILALSLGVLYQSFGFSARRTAVLAREQAAWLTAQSLLADVRSRDMLEAGTSEGEWTQGLPWRTRIDAHPSAVAPDYPLQPFAVTIEVRWGRGDGQRITLHSVEIGKVRS